MLALAEKGEVLTIPLVSLQVVKEKALEWDKPINSPRDLVDFIRANFGCPDREYLFLCCFDTYLKPTLIHIVSIGSLGMTIVHPREVFKLAILANSRGIALLHNHPSGNCEPSADDIAITKRIKECADLLGIDFLDHIIFTADNYCSMSNERLI